MSMFITQIVLYDIKKITTTKLNNIHALVNVKHHKKLFEFIHKYRKGRQATGFVQVLYMLFDFQTPPITNIFNLKTLPNE